MYGIEVLVVIYSPASFKYSVYTGIQWPEVNTVQIQCIHCIQEGSLWLRAACGRGRGRGRGVGASVGGQRSRCVRAAGGRLTMGHVVCSRRAPVADATALPPHRRQKAKTATYGAHVMTATRAATANGRHARCGADIRCVYIQLQLADTLYIQNTVA